MKRSTTFVLLLICCACSVGLRAFAQGRAVWVYFTDKGPDAVRVLDTGSAAQLGLSADALERRARMALMDAGASAPADELLGRLRALSMRKNGATEAVLGEWDVPVHRQYIDAVLASGAQLRAVSKWLNAISVTCTPVQRAAIAALPFVSEVQPVRAWKRNEERLSAIVPSMQRAGTGAGYGLDYGASQAQLEVISVPKVHDIWIDGTGIVCGMVDDGYDWRTHIAMKNTRVLGEYDFINKDTVTQNEGDDPYAQDSHGTLTFSTFAGFREGSLIGPAFNASFWLAKTEVHNSEMPVEEDYWAQGLEWLEGKGAAVVSSSLGYSTFDDSTGYHYDKGDFDGKTAVTSRAASRAARLGVVVSTAMGNEGNSPGTLLAPADADSIVSVGAINYDGLIASFSSNGPTNDNRIKPDIVTPGVRVYCATKDGDSTFGVASGTSLSTPLASGVAALVRSARPELTPVQVRNALRSTADNAATPDSRYGWGKIDAWKAVLANGMVISTNPKIFWNGTRNSIAAWVVSHERVLALSVAVQYSVDGAEREPLRMTLVTPTPGMGQGSGLYLLELPELPKDALVRFQVNASDAREGRTSPYGAPTARHSFRVGESRDRGAQGMLPSAFALGQNYPNPVGAQATAIPYQVPLAGGHVTLELYDVFGRRLATLVDSDHSVGSYVYSFPGAASLATGPYFYALRADGAFLVRRMLVLK